MSNLMMPIGLIKHRTRPWAQAHMAIIGNSVTKGPTHPHLLFPRTICNRHTTQRWTRMAAQIRAFPSVVTRTGFQAWECLAPQYEGCMVRAISDRSLTRIRALIPCRWNNLLASCRYSSLHYTSTGGMGMGSSPYGGGYGESDEW